MTQLAIQKKHREKLQRINKKGAQDAVKQNQITISLKKQINNNKKVTHQLKTSRQQQLMEKDNNLLLKKLVDISMGKRSTIPAPIHTSRNPQRISIYPGLKKDISLESLESEKAPKTTRNTVQTTAKSLHSHIRMQELRRIE